MPSANKNKIVIVLLSLVLIMPVVLAAPTITFISQVPNDLDSFNIIGKPMNVTYSITDASGINDSTVTLYYKNNKTGSDISYYVNGTPVSGYKPVAYSYKSGADYSFLMHDNQVYPATYNFDEYVLEHTVHQQATLANQNAYLSIQLFNVSNTQNYSFFEIMANNTGTTGIRIYYANASYNFASDVSTNPNCVLLYTIPGNNPYNHTHPLYSMHQVIPMAINKTTGKLGNVLVTSTSYFIIRGNSGTTANRPNYYSISNVSRTTAIRHSSNSGSSWTSQSYTVDAHLHQYNGTDNLYYYITANNTLGEQDTSALRQDLINLGGLSPTVTVSSPTATLYQRLINITYEAESPNSYAIMNYSIALYDATYAFVKSINNSTTNSYFEWNSMDVSAGTYTVKVIAYDSVGQQGFSYSAFFTAAGGPTPIDTIHFTASPGATANISVTPGVWDGGGANIGENASTATDMFTLYNTGLIPVDVEIEATDTSTWHIAASPGHNQFQLQWGTSEIVDTSENFTIVILPDTQHYFYSVPVANDIFTDQTQWIVENRARLNIVYVGQLGDIIDGVAGQWALANESMSILENPVTTGLPDGIPYSLIPGNGHEVSPGFNSIFGFERFLSRSYYGGHYGSTNDNNYVVFNASGLGFIVVGLPYDEGAHPDQLAWANTTLQNYPDRRAIVISHYLVDGESFSTQGQETYDALKYNPNLFLMMSGHTKGYSSRNDTYAGNRVDSLESDFSGIDGERSGYLRIMTFCPTENKIDVTTYSPHRDLDGLSPWYMNDSANKFTLTYGMVEEPPETFIYSGGYPQTVNQFWQSNMTKKANSTSLEGIINALTEDETYVYAGGTSKLVSQFWKSNMTLKANTTTYGGDVLALTEDDTYFYVGGETTNKVYQYWKSNMTKKTETASYGGDIKALVVDDTYVYAGGAINQTVKQYYKSNMTLKANTTSYGGTLYALAEDDTYVYAGGETTQKIYQYYKSNMTKKAETISYGGIIYAFVDDDTHLYVGGTDVNMVRQYLKSDMSYVAQTADYGGAICALTMDDVYVYAGGEGTTKVCQYYKSNMTKNAESLSYGVIIFALTCSPYERSVLWDTTWTNLLASPAPFVNNLAYSASQPLGLKVFMPTSSSVNADQITIITFTATSK